MGGGNNLVAGNLIGTDVSGTKDLGNAHDGVVINDTTDTGVVVATTGNNTVGGTTATARNVISGNDANGVAIVGATEVGNLVLGNFIGTNSMASGPGVDLGNSADGVLITSGRMPAALPRPATGLAGPRPRNATSFRATAVDGVAIAGDSGPIGNLIQGNFIGTDSTRYRRHGQRPQRRPYSSAIGSTDSASHNTIGGTATGAGNLISGNKQDGVAILGDAPAGRITWYRATLSARTRAA